MLLNTEMMRGANFLSDICEWIKQHEYLKFPDQDALNALYGGVCLELEQEWNMQLPLLTNPLSEKHISAEMLSNPAVVHFSIPEKPWSSSAGLPFIEEFHKYLAMTPWEI